LTNTVFKKIVPDPCRHQWIDTHCHLDAGQFDLDRAQVVARAKAAHVSMLVLPGVHTQNFSTVRTLAHAHGLAYALGIHPFYTDQASEADLLELENQLRSHQHDPRLVAVGETGIDPFASNDMKKAEHFFARQLQLAQQFKLPVILHVRRSADTLLKYLRPCPCSGIVHAFNGSVQQAVALNALGMKLGFGGAMTFDRALQIRRLATTLPEHALVLETDAPDMLPQWLYQPAAQRTAGVPQRNEPAHLPRIAQVLAGLRGWSLAHTAQQCRANALAALPKLVGL
jgi:TatD DNase family protein